MNPARLDKRITFFGEVEGQDENGYPSTETRDIETVWAMVKTLQGKEFYQAAATQNENTLRFVVRYRKALYQAINEDMKIRMDDRIFEIASIINDNEQNVTLTIVVKELRTK